MAQTIKIKRGGIGSLGPLTLLTGEIALATGSLHANSTVSPFVIVGNSGNTLPVGAILTGSVVPTGFDSKLDGALFYNSTDKQLVRLNSAGNQTLDIAATVENPLTIGAGLFGNSFDGSTAVTISVDSSSLATYFNSSSWAGISGDILINASTGVATIQANSVALGTDTTGNYVASITSGNGLTGGASSEGSTPTLAVGAGTHITVNADDVAVNTTTLIPAISGTILSTVSGDIIITEGGVATIQANSVALGTDTTGNYVATLANATNGGTTITNGSSEGGAATIALNFGNLTEAGVSVSTDYIPFIDGGATGTSRKEKISDLISAIAGTNITAAGGVLSVPSITALNAVTGSYLVSASVIGTANEVEVTSNGAQGIQIGLPNNVTIAGNLTVNGTTTTINSTTVNIDDNIIVVNYGGSESDAGIYAIDNVSTTGTGSLLWDGTSNWWKAGIKDSEKRVVTFDANSGGANTAIQKLDSNSYLVDSTITDDGDDVSIGADVTITAGHTLTAPNAVTFSGLTVTDSANATDEVLFVQSNGTVGQIDATATTDEMVGILGYKSSGGMTFSTVIDGGTF